MISNVPLLSEYGAGKVNIELRDEFRRQGHIVETFDPSDAFPEEDSKWWHRLFPLRFSVKAREYARRQGSRFDIIEALQGVGPLRKQALGFTGLVVARSCGLDVFYQRHLDFQRRTWPDQLPGTPVGRAVTRWSRRRTAAACDQSLRSADLVNLLNDDELSYVSHDLGLGSKCVVFPLGLSDARAQAFACAVASHEQRLKRKEVTFIGAWNLRKGIADWGAIVRHTRELVPDARFRFLGTWSDETAVLRDLRLPPCDWVRVVPHFSAAELPALLSHPTVGALPSYIEGWGLGVLEQLAAGLPTVAYDVPGPRVMLRQLDCRLLCPPGDVSRFGRLLAQLLTLSLPAYTELSTRSQRVASQYLWPGIATTTLNTYAQRLRELQKAANGSV